MDSLLASGTVLYPKWVVELDVEAVSMNGSPCEGADGSEAVDATEGGSGALVDEGARGAVSIHRRCTIAVRDVRGSQDMAPRGAEAREDARRGMRDKVGIDSRKVKL
ncbi:hypothetical protein HK101_011220 [Irineochytrium annulatum]|nr:hypothetical protein HK101_011220 [Irineochytrium annulatum]